MYLRSRYPFVVVKVRAEANIVQVSKKNVPACECKSKINQAANTDQVSKMKTHLGGRRRGPKPSITEHV